MRTSSRSSEDTVPERDRGRRLTCKAFRVRTELPQGKYPSLRVFVLESGPVLVASGCEVQLTCATKGLGDEVRLGY